MFQIKTNPLEYENMSNQDLAETECCNWSYRMEAEMFIKGSLLYIQPTLVDRYNTKNRQ